MEHYRLDAQSACTNESINGYMVVCVRVLHNERLSLFNVSVVSKLSRIPVFHSETKPENDFTQMKKGFALGKKHKRARSLKANCSEPLYVIGFREEVQPLCNISEPMC